ncbi:probable small intestine urate exporter [Suncus etruscus]|uniref:probable small intestine urate exporter n=1 Tax=Suncus etruscus TaxID=109475 RepID=UPI002110177A|nr:probable small intestine urate exporter [Suncus etruscus]
MLGLSIAMPAMVNTSAQTNRTNTFEEEPLTVFNVNWNETQEEIKAMAPVYDWNPQIQRIIFGSVNYVSFFTPLPSGYLSGIYGAKYVVGVSVCISSILTLFIPLATDTGVVLLIVLWIVQGIAQVNVTTSQYSIWIKWAPPLERNKLITIAMSGSSLGCFIIFLLGGILALLGKMSGFLSSLPFVLGYFCIILEGKLADLLHFRKLLKLNTIRKLFTAVGVLCSGAFILSLNWVRSSQVTTLAFLIVSCVFGTCLYVEVMINMMNIVPRYAAFLKGLALIFEQIAGAISPTVSGYLLNQDSESSWSNIFFLSIAIRLVGLIIYLIFGKAEVQDWAREQSFTQF